MQKNMKLACYVMLITAVTAISAEGYAYADTAQLTDSQVETVIVAVVVGSLGAPIYGYATQEVNKTTSTRDPFDWGQYAIAIIVILPLGFGLLLAELTSIQITQTGLLGIIVIFVMVFIQAIGLNNIKSSAKRAIINPSAKPKI